MHEIFADCTIAFCQAGSCKHSDAQQCKVKCCTVCAGVIVKRNMTYVTDNYQLSVVILHVLARNFAAV